MNEFKSFGATVVIKKPKDLAVLKISTCVKILDAGIQTSCMETVYGLLRTRY